MGLWFAGCSNSSSSKAAASEGPRRTLWYVEGLNDARTLLADCFSILLEQAGGLLILQLRTKVDQLLLQR
jgi:hypothetical protein